MLVADVTFKSVVKRPVPELVMDDFVAFRTGQADEPASFFTPSYTVEVSWSSTNATHEPPV